MDKSLVVVITGMAGAGRSTAAKVLEDLGFFVVDNLPPRLIARLVEASSLEDETRSRVAVAVDSRIGAYSFNELQSEILRMQRFGIRTLVVFVDAEDQELVRRFQESRRPHPMPSETLEDSIVAERKLLEDLRGSADLLIDTTDLNVHDLRNRLVEAFEAPAPRREMRVSITSFGFKHGSPRDLDLVFDVRFLPNPHWIPELRPLTGKDKSVADYVLTTDAARGFMERVEDLLGFLIPKFVDEGKAYLRIGVGCTGGRHRSVAISEELGRLLTESGVNVTVRHRDADE